jgi:hypothetical protein
MESCDGLQGIDSASLTATIRHATERSGLVLGDWSVQPIHGGLGEGQGIYRLSGHARDAGGTVRWSLILKVLAPSSDADSPSDWNYWQREAEAYRSGALANLPGPLRAPRCFAVTEQPNGHVWVWLEDIVEVPGPPWSLTDYRQIARRLGQFNGSYLVGRPLPSDTWVSHRWIRSRVESNAAFVPMLQERADHPWVRWGFPPDVVARLLRIWADREMYFQALEQLPQTLCHMDFHRRNVLICSTPTGGSEPVVIDWAFVGQGAIGADTAPLVLTTFGFFDVDVMDAAGLEEQVLTGYLEGLGEAGWHGDPRHVRLGYAATGALWHGIGGLHLALPILLDERFHPVIEQAVGQPYAVVCDRWVEVHRRFTLRLADEARTLMRAVGDA